jgi:hypothetical protein
MTELILLVVAAAWLAVLIPPMLRSRVENRPSSSVTDFRRQLTKLQDSATPARGAVRTMGRPLAQSPLSRPVANGRPGQPTLRSGVSPRGATSTVPARQVEPVQQTARGRTHGAASGYRTHGDPTGERRRPAPRRDPAKQRRTNVLFLLAVSTVCTGFLALTTSATAMLYAFVLSLLALSGFVYMLIQSRPRSSGAPHGDWID